MKAIIEKGKADNSIQSCFISECGIEIIFHNNDLAAAKEKGRTDVVAPATGHPDCIRKDGFIVSVPGFVR